MPAEQHYLSIGELAARTSLEESLIRFYESEHADELPAKILRGKTYLFDERAVDVLTRIHRRRQAEGRTEPTATESAPSRFARVLAVTSGKGGVGKTSVALNLAICFARQGRTTVVLDADLGMANIHLLAGIQPERGLRDYIRGEATLAECIADGPEGIGILPGASGIIDMADSTPADRGRMLEALSRIEANAEMVVVDTGAGMGAGVRQFLLAADEVLFVLTPEITSLADAYGLLKALHAEGYAGRVSSVVNLASSLDEASSAALRFSACADKFLGRPVESAGYLMKDATVGAATARRMPYVLFSPSARVSRNTWHLAETLLGREDETIRLHSTFLRFQRMLRDKAGTSRPATGGGA